MSRHQLAAMDLRPRPRASPGRHQLQRSREPGRPTVRAALLTSGAARLVVLPLTGVANLVIARVITNAVGIDRFGAVMLIATLSQLLTFADLGAGAAVATASAQRDDVGVEDGQFHRTLLTGARTMLCSAGVLSLVAVAIGVIREWPALLGIHGTHPGGLSANVAAVLALLAFSASLPFALGEAILRGGGRLHLAVLLTGLSAPGALILTLILYVFDAPPFAFALAIPLGATFGAMCCAVGAVRTVPGIVVDFGRQVLRPRRFPGSAIAATAVPWFLVMIGLPLALQSDRIIIAHRLPDTDLSDYSYAAQLYTPVWSVVSTAALALWPVFSRSQSRDSLRRSWLTGLALLAPAGLALGAVFVLAARVVIGWMSGGTATIATSLLMSFGALILVQSVHVGTGIMLISPRQLQFQAGCVLALVATNIPLSWYLAPVMGPAGPVVASVVTVALCQLVPGVIAADRATSARGSTVPPRSPAGGS